jgi:DNA-directed RNA polymerase subunit alpha
MEELLLPSKIQIIPGEDERKATLVVEPCYYGFGMTVGNALRRVLLSSLPGAAVTAVKIEGAPHEFSTLTGVKEDALEIMLNLKSLRMRLFTDEVVRLKLSVKGEREVTAADIEATSDVEIVNTDHHLATLTEKGAVLDMEIFVKRGRGYVPVEEQEKEKGEIGLIAVDAMFSPVKEVGFRVEDTRVGQITNYDKLVMDVETDGTITPEDAIDQSISILLDHFNLLMSRGAMPADDSEEVAPISEDEEVASEAEEPVEAEEAPEEEEEEKPKKKASKKK